MIYVQKYLYVLCMEVIIYWQIILLDSYNDVLLKLIRHDIINGNL